MQTRLERVTERFDAEYRHEKQRGYKRCQVYALAADGTGVWAGPHIIRRPSLRTARRVQRKWREWRYLYDHSPENVKRDYPAKHCHRVAKIGIEWNGVFQWFRV